MATDRRAYAREYYWKNREKRLAMQRAWYAKNKEQQSAYRKARGDHRKYRERKAYMREWWGKLKATDPERHDRYMKRSNRTRAIHGLPPEVHEMRTVLYEFRSHIVQGQRA